MFGQFPISMNAMSYFLRFCSERPSIGEIELLVHQYPEEFDVSLFFDSACQDILTINMKLRDLWNSEGEPFFFERIEELEDQRDLWLDWVCDAIDKEREEVN